MTEKEKIEEAEVQSPGIQSCPVAQPSGQAELDQLSDEEWLRQVHEGACCADEA